MNGSELRTYIFENASMRSIVESYNIDIKRNNTFLCPFHDDTKPSMSIMKNDKGCKCFACGEGGNVYTFIEKYEEKINHRSLTSNEIFKTMAQRSGLTLDITGLDNPTYNYQNQTIVNPNENLYNSIEYSKELYKYYLSTELGKEAKEYLEKRGITQEIIEEFDIGFSPYNGLKEYINQNELLTVDNLEKTNLIRLSDKGDIQEVFYNRIMIPIKNDRGKIIGFGGRILKDKQNVPKYLNTKETDIFHKSDNLFNFNRASNYARNSEIFIVEGYMDCIGARIMGIKNCVGLMGVELSEKQIENLKKVNATITLALDGDTRGQEAIIKHIPRLQENGLNVSVIDISNIEDGKYKDFGDLSENKKTIADINKVRVSPFTFTLDKKYFKEQELNVDTIKRIFDMAKEDKFIVTSKDELEFSEYVSNHTDFTREEIENIIHEKKLEETLTPLETYQNTVFKNSVENEINEFLDNYNDNVLKDYYTSHKNKMFEGMFQNLLTNEAKYFNTEFTKLNVAMMFYDITKEDKDYMRYETINRFSHEQAFKETYVVNLEENVREKISLNEIQKDMIIKQYHGTLEENVRQNMKNVEQIYIINKPQDLIKALPNDKLLSREIKEQMLKHMRENKEMEFLSYASIFPQEHLDYIDPNYKTTDGKNYKTVLFVNNLSGELNITKDNFVIDADSKQEDEVEKEMTNKEENKEVQQQRVFTIHRSLIQHEKEQGIFTRIPNTKGTKYMYLNKDKYKELTDETSKYTIDINETIQIYDKQGNLKDEVLGKDIMHYWEDKTQDKNKKQSNPKVTTSSEKKTISKDNEKSAKEILNQYGNNNSNNSQEKQIDETLSNNVFKENGSTTISQKMINVPSFRIDAETKYGFHISTSEKNQYLFVSNKAATWKDAEKTTLEIKEKFGSCSLYQVDKEGKKKIIKRVINFKDTQKIIGTNSNIAKKIQWKMLGIKKSDINRIGDYITIPLLDEHKQKGYVCINKRFFVQDKENLYLRYNEGYSYKMNYAKDNKNININDLKNYYSNYKAHEKASKGVNLEMERGA